MLPLAFSTEELLKRTTSRCPVCQAACPAEVWRVGTAKHAKVFLKRTCPEHGEASACIASDARFYWVAQGNPGNAGCCGSSGVACCAADGAAAGTLGRNANPEPGTPEKPNGEPFEKLATCLALIEIVHSCNLACPTCYADSPTGPVNAVPLAELKERIEGVVQRKGEIEILQLSGGEPTLHPEFFELLGWLMEHPRIRYVLLNTNGVRIAREDAFLDALAKTFRYGKFQLYLQFDGPQAAGQRELREADLRELRRRALERCLAIGVPVTLAMTVTRENLPHLWEAIEFGLGFPHVRGISFQPVFGSGRLPSATAPASALARLNTADIVVNAVEQSGGRLRYDDFTPLPCGDPNCATIGYLLKVGGAIRSISDFLDFTGIQGFLKDKIRYSLDDLARCGCENEPLGELLKQLELDERHTFRLFIKPFMDAWTWDQDRIDRCCTHVIRPDGQLDSFCRYYSGFSEV